MNTSRQPGQSNAAVLWKQIETCACRKERTAFIYSDKTLFSALEIIPFGYTKKGQPLQWTKGNCDSNLNDFG